VIKRGNRKKQPKLETVKRLAAPIRMNAGLYSLGVIGLSPAAQVHVMQKVLKRAKVLRNFN
jgi:hypothetical protein